MSYFSFFSKSQLNKEPSFRTTINNRYTSNINNSGSNTSSNSLFKQSTTDPYQYVDRVRVAVIGDTAVGKTSLVHLLCNGEVLDSSVSWTVGCNTDVKVYEFHSKDYYIEFLDVGGALKHKLARPMLYHQLNGLIVVYDLTNKNSLSSLKKWIFEVLSKVTPPNKTSNWDLKETDNPQILELEGVIIDDSKNITSSSNMNNNNNISPPLPSTISSPPLSTLLQSNQYASSSNLKLPSVFLSQTSSFLPTTLSPTTSGLSHGSSVTQSGNIEKLIKLPVIILGNKSDLYYDHKFIENDKLGKLSLIVSGKNKDSFKPGCYNSSKLDIFYNKMISNLMGGKKRNITTMNFNFTNTNENQQQQQQTTDTLHVNKKM